VAANLRPAGGPGNAGRSRPRDGRPGGGLSGDRTRYTLLAATGAHPAARL